MKHALLWLSAFTMLFNATALLAEETDLTAQNRPCIRLTMEDATLYILLEENSASRSLLAQLPMTLTFEDYNATEKIAYPEEALDTSDAPDRCDPEIGTLAYYAPWGNLCIFYRDFQESAGLVPLGKIEEGMDLIQNRSGAWTALLEDAGKQPAEEKE